MPSKDGHTLRLIDLVGQTAGLPREVPRPPSPPEDPFASNTKEAQLAAIQKDPYICSRRGPRRSIPTSATTCSALALANAAGKPYADLLKERRARPARHEGHDASIRRRTPRTG